MEQNRDFDSLLDSLLGSEAPGYLAGIAGTDRDWFRLNPLKFTPDFQMDILSREGYHPRAAEGFANIWSILRPEDPGRALGKSLSHFLGNIYIQNIASMIPPLVLDPQPGERVLDLCAAPGSKTSMLASLMEGKGLLVANDRTKKRLQSLVFNLRKCCVPNVLFFNGFGEHFGNLYYECFDRVLVDPPCSALGTLAKNPEVLTWWNRERSASLANVQEALLISGIKALRPGGRLVYSTCTITPEENEGVVDRVLRRYGLELEEISLPAWMRARPALDCAGSGRFHPEIRKAVRLYPQDAGSEGFFIACLRKTGPCGVPRLNRPPELHRDQLVKSSDPRVNRILAELEAEFGLDRGIFNGKAYRIGKALYWVDEEAFSFPCHLPLVSAGYPLAHTGTDAARLATEAIHVIGDQLGRNRLELDGPEELEAFVNRRDIPARPADNYQTVVFFDGHPIGHGIIRRELLLSRFPRAGWAFRLGS